MDGTNHVAPPIGIDDVNHYLVELVSGNGSNVHGGVELFDLSNLNFVNGCPFRVNFTQFGATNAVSFALATNGGASCATQPAIGTLSCTKNVPNIVNPQPPVVTVSGLNQPLALVMTDASHVVAYCAGDQTLRRFTIDVTAGTSTASGVFAIQGLTNVDSSFPNQYVGGWYVVHAGSTIVGMGQLVNTDGSVSRQELFAVPDTLGPQIGGNFEAPAGTTLITPDALNNAVVLEYPDTTGTSPIMRHGRFYPTTGNYQELSSTSPQVPDAGFLAVGDLLLGFTLNNISVQPNQ
jgi:hypothetical protein